MFLLQQNKDGFSNIFLTPPQRVYDNAVEVAALERAQAVINLEWKLVEEKRRNFLEYIRKNFSPKIVFYDDDPTNNEDGEIHGLTLMTKKINEQVKKLSSIIVDFKERETLHRTFSNNLSETIREQSEKMGEILTRMGKLEESVETIKQNSSYQIYYPSPRERVLSQGSSMSYTTTIPPTDHRGSLISEAPASPSFMPRAYRGPRKGSESAESDHHADQPGPSRRRRSTSSDRGKTPEAKTPKRKTRRFSVFGKR